MGMCRGLNLLLGISIVPAAVAGYRLLALVPVIYIAAITMISRGEVFGGKKQVLYFAGFLYALVIGTIAWYAFQQREWWTLFFLGAFAFMIFRPLITAANSPIGSNIGKAVKAGVLALILMNAAWAAAFGQYYLAVLISLLLPLSLKLAKMFAVT
jgi:4-hydroxybenzoate polyprenyltransferase